MNHSSTMDHYMEPQTIVDEDSQDAVVNANVAELESSQYDETRTATTPVKEANNDNIPQPPPPERPRKNPTSTTGTRKHPASSKRKLFTNDDVVEEEDEQPSSLGKNT